MKQIKTYLITEQRGGNVVKVLGHKYASNMEEAESMFADWAWRWLIEEECGFGSENEKLINKINDGELGNWFYCGLTKYAITEVSE